MTPRPAPPEHGTILHLGEHRVRVRRIADDHALIRVQWDILDGERVIGSMVSRPSREDCALAVSRARGQVEPVDAPKAGQFIPGALPTPNKRTAARRERQMAEEAEPLEQEP